MTRIREGPIRAVVIIATSLILIMLSFESANAIADIPNGTASGSTYFVNDTIDNWNQLEGLLSSYSNIDMNGAKVYDNNLANFIKLGTESGITFISRVQCLTPNEIYPAKILPAYTVSTSKFAYARNIKVNYSHTMFSTFTWKGMLTYVYGASRNNSVTINHGVQDENAVAMLPYASSSSVFGGASVVGNSLLFASINAPDAGKSAEIKYDGVINCYTSLGGRIRSKVNMPLYYCYQLSETFLSPVKLDIEAVIVGAIEIRNKDDEGNAIEGASYAVFEDAECTTRAKQYSGGAWLPVDDIVTDASGVGRVSNLKAGRYYIKETVPAEDYKANEEVKAVDLNTPNVDLSLDTSSGEGASQRINVENTVLNPKWNENAVTGNMSFEDSDSNYETVSASDYSDSDVFIKSSGNGIAFNSTGDISTLESLSNISSTTYKVEVGDVEEEFSAPSAALAYINETLIEDGSIDDAAARGNITLSMVGDGVYLDDNNSSELSFESQELENKILDFSVPESVTIKVNSGDIISSFVYSDGNTDYVITNNSEKGAISATMSLENSSNWDLVADESNWSSQKIDSRKYSLVLGGSDMTTGSHAVNSIPASGSAHFDITGHVSLSTSALQLMTGRIIANVQWVE